MSKIYEALEKHHDDPFSPEGISDESAVATNQESVRFHEPGISVATGNATRKIDQSSIETSIESIELPDSGSFEDAQGDSKSKTADRYFAGHLYSISLDDVRSVSAAIRSAVKTTRARCIGLIGLGAGQTGAALVRDLAAYEATLDVNGVLLVDTDRVRHLQSRFYVISERKKSFDAARVTGDWRTAVESDVSRGVDLVSFSAQRRESGLPIEKQTYQSFLKFCRAGYELTLFDLPADGLGSETHTVGAMLDSVIVVCPVDVDATVVNRYVNDLKHSGLQVLGAVTIT